MRSNHLGRMFFIYLGFIAPFIFSSTTSNAVPNADQARLQEMIKSKERDVESAAIKAQEIQEESQRDNKKIETLKTEIATLQGLLQEQTPQAQIETHKSIEAKKTELREAETLRITKRIHIEEARTQASHRYKMLELFKLRSDLKKLNDEIAQQMKAEARGVARKEASEARRVDREKASEARRVARDEASEARKVARDEASEARKVARDEASEARRVDREKASEARRVAREEGDKKVIQEMKAELARVDEETRRLDVKNKDNRIRIDNEAKKLEEDLGNKIKFDACEKTMMEYFHSRMETQSKKQDTQQRIENLSRIQQLNLAALQQLNKERNTQCIIFGNRTSLQEVMKLRNAIAIRDLTQGGSWLGSLFSSHSAKSRKAKDCALNYLNEVDRTSGVRGKRLSPKSLLEIEALAVRVDTHYESATANGEREMRKSEIQTTAVNSIMDRHLSAITSLLGPSGGAAARDSVGEREEDVAVASILRELGVSVTPPDRGVMSASRASSVREATDDSIVNGCPDPTGLSGSAARLTAVEAANSRVSERYSAKDSPIPGGSRGTPDGRSSGPATGGTIAR